MKSYRPYLVTPGLPLTYIMGAKLVGLQTIVPSGNWTKLFPRSLRVLLQLDQANFRLL